MTDVRLLPEGFAPLEPFVPRWAVASFADRDAARGTAPAADRTAFYAAASEMLAPALAHLDARPPAAFDDRDQRLMQLVLSLAHVALAEEIQGEAEAVHTRLRAFMPITWESPS